MEKIFLYFLPFSGADPSSWIQDPDSEWDGPGSGQHRTEHTHSVSVKIKDFIWQQFDFDYRNFRLLNFTSCLRGWSDDTNRKWHVWCHTSINLPQTDVWCFLSWSWSCFTQSDVWSSSSNMTSPVTSQTHPRWCVQECPSVCDQDHLSPSLTGGGTGCPRSLSTSVLAADWPTTRGCRRSKGRSFDMTGRPTAAPPTHTHTAHAGVWPCCRDTHSLRTCDTMQQPITRLVWCYSSSLTDHVTSFKGTVAIMICSASCWWSHVV